MTLYLYPSYLELQLCWRHIAYPSKTFIGKIEKGFDWMGIWLNDKGIQTVAPRAINNYLANLRRFYEQPIKSGIKKTLTYSKNPAAMLEQEKQRVSQQVAQYQQHWQQWAMAGNMPKNVWGILERKVFRRFFNRQWRLDFEGEYWLTWERRPWCDVNVIVTHAREDRVRLTINPKKSVIPYSNFRSTPQLPQVHVAGCL